ncbi:hypothetical protein GCM10010112_90880 [Actinoplanes lobatus]|uniref:Uncharacterized protein n=1 Tax=Actinoplanes lobatus TaxID=113568 RepID=A0ABQ4AXX5_9ACTN|nr:hypothetical protein GCM10010112_90880 [Actinoplanes lobatus]GIE45872.1 hypothetical protein Alo02nite_87700 [Actinoplanes lobatus]
MCDGVEQMPRVLRLIGYWDGPEATGGLPDVCDFVSIGVNPDETRTIAEYLRAGAVHAVAGRHISVPIVRFAQR